MTHPLGQMYIPDLKEREETVAVARKIATLMDEEGPVSFQVGMNALVLSLTAAIRGSGMTIENKIKLSNGVSETLMANILSDAPEGSTN